MYYKTQDPSLERSFRGHKDVITGLCFKPTMSQLASSSMDHSVMIWNFKPQLRAFRFVGHTAAVTGLDFASSGNLLASSSRDKTVRLWTPNVKGDVVVFKAHTSSVRSVQFSQDGEQLLTSSDDKTIKLWSTHRTKFQYTLAGHLNWVRSAKFSPDGRLIVSGSDDKTVKLWDLNSKTCIKTYWDHLGMVSSVAFHPSGTLVATASTDRSIKVFDIRMHKLIQHYGDAHGPLKIAGSSLDGNTASGGVNSIAFGGEDGEWLVSTGTDGLVKVWDVKEGHLFYTLHGHKHGPTTAAVFSPLGDFFATGGSDAQVMVWKSNFDTLNKVDTDLGKPATHKYSHAVHTDPGIHAPKQPSPISQVPIQSAGPHIVQKTIKDPEIVQVGAQIVETRPSPEPFEQKLQPLDPKNDQLLTTLGHISRQIDVLTQTMSILESRLTMNEDKIMELTRLVNPPQRYVQVRSGNSSPTIRDHQSRPRTVSHEPLVEDYVQQEQQELYIS
ncbi:WD40-repeat-containing domain protein [Gorgonomyces haynaldii]|nr:WD40-repeat-containing domain protein [Gorgonomyces haynaldii]